MILKRSGNYNMRFLTSLNSPSVTDFVESQHDDVQVVHQNALFHVFLQNQADGVEEAVQNRQQYELVLLLASHHIEEQIDIAFIDNGETIQHDDLGVGSVRLVEKILLVLLLLLHGRKDVFVVVLGQDPVAIVVHDDHAFDCVQTRLLKREAQTTLIIGHIIKRNAA